MPTKMNPVEYQTVIVGAAYLVKGILTRLGFVPAIDEALKHQPEIEATYGSLAQVIVVNRLTFQPVPLYSMADWAAEHRMDHVFDIQAEWLDDDRMGAMLEAVADNQVSIWSTVLKNAVKHFHVELEQLHGDTTSVYFEGAYTDEQSVPLGGGERTPMLVKGYNKDGQRNKVQLVLSLITSGRVPLWYRPWNGNQTDDAVYLADMTALRQTMLIPDNAILIGDRKLCSRDTMIAFCRQKQLFLAAHPWTDTAKRVWWQTWQQLQVGELQWTPVDYASRNNARKPPEKRPQYQVCKVVYKLEDEQAPQGHYELCWVFVWSSSKAKQDVRRRAKVLQAGEEGLERIARLLGKYDYTTRKTIEARLDKTLRKTKAHKYFTYTLYGSDQDQAWELRWERRQNVITGDERFDGVSLLCTNAPTERLSAAEVMIKYKEQINVEQSIDFIKSPVHIRPMWLHSPKRIAGLTLLIMIAVLVAALLEHQVRRWIAKTGRLLQGLMPEGRDNPYPTAKAMLRAFQSYALVIVLYGKRREQLYHPKLRPVQQQIWDIMELPSLLA